MPWIENATLATINNWTGSNRHPARLPLQERLVCQIKSRPGHFIGDDDLPIDENGLFACLRAGKLAAPLDAMPEQLSLSGVDTAASVFRPETASARSGKLLGYTLFLAIFPLRQDAQCIAQAATGLRGQHGLLGKQLSPARLHITLHALANFHDTIPQAVVDAARAAAASVVCPTVPMVFDRALTFPESDAFVLRCDARSDAGVARLRHLLTLALRQAGLRPHPSRTPHMTLLYDPRHIAEHPIRPVCWTATRFALIVSHVGLHHHQWLDHWSLADRL